MKVLVTGVTGFLGGRVAQILVDVTHENYPDTPAARRSLHVGATRAVHQLWLTTLGTPSPMLAEASAVAAP